MPADAALRRLRTCSYVEAHQESNPAVRGSFTQNIPTGKSWRFHHWIWRGNAYLDDYHEFNTTGLTWSPDERLTFAYDHLDRLANASPESGAQGYSQALAYNPVGNLTSLAGVTHWYSDTLHKHAVTHLGGVQKFWYDADGNMTTRVEGSATYTQTWDVENRLSGLSGAASATLVYDGDGNRVKATVNGVTTVYLGNYYEQSGTVTKTYVYAGGQRVALRQGSTVYYLLGDHLGSTAITANSSGGLHAELRYKPWGENRYTSGTTPTTFRYTGQREEVGLGSLYFYQARFYSPVLGRFISADTIVPEAGNPQALNRYAYTYNNPLRYIDPSGHRTCSERQAATGDETCDQNITNEEEEYEPPLALPSPIPEHWLGLPIFQPSGAVHAAAVAWATYWSNPGKYSSDYFIFWWASVYREHCECGAHEIPIYVPEEWRPYVADIELQALALLDIQRSHNAFGGGGRTLRAAPTLPKALRGGPADTHVYFGVSQGRPAYVGITNNLARRQAEHGSRFILVQLTTSPVTRGQARAIEQALVVRNPQFQNINNAISPQHPWYQDAVNWGEWWLQQQGIK